MSDWMRGGDDDLSMFYRRLAEIEQLQEIDPQEARRQYELLMQDYPGMIEDMRGQQTAGRSLMAEGFEPAAALRGPAQNPFAYDTINPGGILGKYFQISEGGKMAREAEEGIQTQRGLQLEEKIKTARAGTGANAIAGVTGPNAWDLLGGGSMQDPMRQQKTLAQMLREKEEEERRKNPYGQAF